MIKFTKADLAAQEAHVSYVRIQEMVAERTGDPEKIAAAAKRYESAVAGVHMILDNINAQVEIATRPVFSPRQRRMVRAGMREQIRRGHW
jgi:chromosome segregation and condensation protein ScpB